MEFDTYKSMLLDNGGYRGQNIEYLKMSMLDELQDNPAYQADCKRNGKVQPCLVLRSDVDYKLSITTMPDDDLCSGDYIEVFGETYIVITVRNSNDIQKTGICWLCNLDLYYQNFSSDIIVKKAVLDSGVYSTTTTRDTQIQIVDKQFKLYLPFDDDTEKLFIDKRIAVDTRYEKTGKKILECFKITGSNVKARSYGKNSHLLICELRSDVYNETTDNIDLLICDYITSDNISSAVNNENNISSLKIKGRDKIPVGSTRKYELINTNNVEFSWNVDANLSVNTQINNGILEITIPDDESYIGLEITINAISDNQNAQFKAVVTS